MSKDTTLLSCWSFINTNTAWKVAIVRLLDDVKFSSQKHVGAQLNLCCISYNLATYDTKLSS